MTMTKIGSVPTAKIMATPMCEWALLKSFSRLELVKGNGHSQTV